MKTFIKRQRRASNQVRVTPRNQSISTDAPSPTRENACRRCNSSSSTCGSDMEPSSPPDSSFQRALVPQAREIAKIQRRKPAIRVMMKMNGLDHGISICAISLISHRSRWYVTLPASLKVNRLVTRSRKCNGLGRKLNHFKRADVRKCEEVRNPPRVERRRDDWSWRPGKTRRWNLCSR